MKNTKPNEFNSYGICKQNHTIKQARGEGHFSVMSVYSDSLDWSLRLGDDVAL